MAGKEKLTAVRVAARGERGFNCAGRYWPPDATDAEVDEATLRRIEKERELVVVRFPTAPLEPDALQLGAAARAAEGPLADAAAALRAKGESEAAAQVAAGASGAPKGGKADAKGAAAPKG